VNVDGRSIQPDAIIYLPDNKHIIIDSKVSLVGYEQAVNATTEEDRVRFLKDHLQSVRTHVKQLSDKKYHTAFEINSPDFVSSLCGAKPPSLPPCSRCGNFQLCVGKENCCG
jgi:DNA recombination protein RmuC